MRRRSATPAIPPSISKLPIKAHGVSAGASAAVLAQVPACPGRLHCSSGAVHARSQHTPSTQKGGEHCDGVVQAPPCGTGVLVGVEPVWVTVPVAVAVAVLVAVPVLVVVPVLVGVSVTVPVLVAVPVAVAVDVGVWGVPKQDPAQKPVGSVPSCTQRLLAAQSLATPPPQSSDSQQPRTVPPPPLSLSQNCAQPSGQPPPEETVPET